MKTKLKLREETTLSRAVRIAQDKASYDAACKRILAQKGILARIMKECVPEFRECSIEDIENKYIEGIPQIGEVAVFPDEADIGSPERHGVPTIIHGESTEDNSMTEGTVVYDVRFRAVAPKNGAYITLLLNAEGQKDYTPGYPLPKRGIYYCSRMISSQYGMEFESGHYEDIKKVYSIWICLDPPQYRQNMITRYEIHEVDMIGSAQEPRENYDLLSLVMVRLGNAAECNNQTLQMLDVLFSQERQDQKRERLETEFGLPMTQELKKEVSQMCNFSDVVEKRGIEKGVEQGRREAELETARKMMENGLPVELICRCTHFTKAEVERITVTAN